MAKANLKGSTIIITGASRGIGREMAIRFARDGANIVVAAKTAEPQPKLSGTIHSVTAEVEKAGGKALACMVDVRNEEDVQKMIHATIDQFGAIDALVNNAGAISLTGTEQTPMKRFDLMNQINVRAVYMCSQACLPYLRKSPNPHILNMSPPISLNTKWLAGHLAYTLSKYGMTLCTVGMAREFEKDRIAVNSLWPKTTIHTAAIEMLLGDKGKTHSRLPSIVAEAAYHILTTTNRELTGECLIDEDVLKKEGETNFDKYACTPGESLYPDLFLS